MPNIPVACPAVGVGVRHTTPPDYLTLLKDLIQGRPSEAIWLLSRLPDTDPVARLTLVAQAAAQLGELRYALLCARRAVRLAQAQTPADAGWLLAAVQMLADLAVLAGAGGSDAVDPVGCCALLHAYARQHGDTRRMLLAAVLGVISTYHERSCRQAAGTLGRLHDLYARAYQDPPTAEAVARVQAALDDSCAGPGRLRSATTVAGGPLAGAGLDPAWAIRRLLARPGVHDCAPSRSSS